MSKAVQKACPQGERGCIGFILFHDEVHDKVHDKVPKKVHDKVLLLRRLALKRLPTSGRIAASN